MLDNSAVAETNELLLAEIKKWRDFALVLAEEHDQIKEKAD